MIKRISGAKRLTETASVKQEVRDKRLTQNYFKPRADDTRFRI